MQFTLYNSYERLKHLNYRNSISCKTIDKKQIKKTRGQHTKMKNTYDPSAKEY